jgi:formylglycine-generating enzyme required for sulfatase activity
MNNHCVNVCTAAPLLLCLTWLSWAQATPAAATASEMIPIPSGSFMRADGERISVDAFSLLSTEVTWSQFAGVREWALANGYDFEEGSGQQNRPAQNITWYDAVKWCNALSEMSGRTPVYAPGGEVYRSGRVDLRNADVRWEADGFRLPTEAEWEYAYRAGTDTSLYWGEHPRQGTPVNHEYAVFHVWGTDEIDGGPLPVASKKPNAFGLYDMAGNVEEWVWDRYAVNYEGGGDANPRGPDQGPLRVLRGGGFVIDRLFDANRRHPSYPFLVNCDVGFRVASGDPQADVRKLDELPEQPLTPNDLTPFAEERELLDVREDTDEAAWARLMQVLDPTHPNLQPAMAKYAEGDAAAALEAVRDLLVPRLAQSGLEPKRPGVINQELADKWLAIYRAQRPVRWTGPETDLEKAWEFYADTHLAKLYAKQPENRELAAAYLWKLNQTALYAKPNWNRLSIAERGSKGRPRDNFMTFIGFDAGHPIRPFACMAWMLRHGLPASEIPPRTLANALYYAVVDRLSTGLQDDRGNVPNQVWGNAMEIIEFAQVFPELRDSDHLREIGIERVRNAMGTVMPDGTDLEASLNYNSRLFEDRDKLNHLFPDRSTWPDWLVEFNRRTDYRRLMYAGLATPFATFPAIGNQQSTDTRARTALRGWQEDKQLEGIAPAMSRLLTPPSEPAPEGPKPAFTSVAFPYGGYYVQRSGWTWKDHYLFMRSSRGGVGHNKPDNNNVQVAAYGAWLVHESGSPAYWDAHLPDHQKKYLRYFTGGNSIGNVFMASALSVDGLRQAYYPDEKPPHGTAGWEAPRELLWHTSPHFDLAEGRFTGAWQSEEPISDKNMDDLEADFGPEETAEIRAYNDQLKSAGQKTVEAEHRRLVVFLRDPKFWVLVDQVDGGSEYTQTWNFPPADKGLNTERYALEPSDQDLYYGLTKSLGYTPSQVRSDTANKRIVTISHYRPNIAILNFLDGPVGYRQHYGNKFPFKGWQSFAIVGEKVPAVQMEGTWRGDAPMVTVLYPIEKRGPRDKTLDAGLEGFRDASRGGVSGFVFENKKAKVTVQAAREPIALEGGQVTATATLLLVEEAGAETLRGIALGCTSLEIKGGTQPLPGPDFEFSLVKGKWATTPIRSPETLQWDNDGQGQLAPVYRLTSTEQKKEDKQEALP